MTTPTGQPDLSILIPAYRYPAGVVRILESLGESPAGRVEVLIFDDSPDDSVESAVERTKERLGIAVDYRRHAPPLGAPANWNALLDAARGRFCWLLHHDEFPTGKGFVERLLAALSARQDLDVLILDCVLVDEELRFLRRHLPTWLRASVLRRAPGYLFRRNVIGPTSTVVVRRSVYPRFDATLRWLVDVEAYVRLLRSAPHLALCPSLQVQSVQGRDGSISARLAPHLSVVDAEERNYLRGLHPQDALWLDPYPGALYLRSFARGLEVLLWSGLRLVQRAGRTRLGRSSSRNASTTR